MNTREERQSDARARALVKAINRIETWDGDPEDIMLDASILAHSMDTGTKEVIAVIRNFYLGKIPKEFSDPRMVVIE